MKKLRNLNYLPAAVGVLGFAALGIHQLLYLVGVDHLGLPILGHPLNYVLALLSLGVLALVAALVLPLKGTGDYPVNFPAGIGGALGDLVMAGCILGTVMFQPCAMAGAISQVWRWMGLAAALALLWIGLFRFAGKTPGFGLYLLVCLFLSVHVVSHYRAWSSTAQVRSYLFPLLANMTLLFFTYYHMAFTIGYARRRMLLFMGLMTIYLGLVGLFDTDYVLLWLGSIFWAWQGLCAWHVPPEEKKEAPENAPEAES